jgi:hypothetical protein
MEVASPGDDQPAGPDWTIERLASLARDGHPDESPEKALKNAVREVGADGARGTPPLLPSAPSTPRCPSDGD